MLSNVTNCGWDIQLMRMIGLPKTFFDAYFGPLKDKHRYWVGLLLLVRGALFIMYAATPTSMATITLGLLCYAS